MLFETLLLLTQMGMGQPANGQDLGRLADTNLRNPDRVVQATVALHIGLANEGSGVVLGKKGDKFLALSAYHLFQGKAKEGHATFFGAGDPPKADKELMKVELVDSWPDIDLALLSVEAPKLPISPLQLAAARTLPAKVRGTTHTSGCDKGYPSLRPELLAGKVLTTKNAGEIDAFYWEMADPSIPGRSGGPLVDCSGQILGICSGTDRKGKGMYVHIDEIRAALKRKGHTDLLAGS